MRRRFPIGPGKLFHRVLVAFAIVYTVGIIYMPGCSSSPARIDKVIERMGR